jgi:uncharacterized membrane protein
MLNYDIIQGDMFQFIIHAIIYLFIFSVCFNVVMWLLGFRYKGHWGHEYANKHVKRNCDCYHCNK